MLSRANGANWEVAGFSKLCGTGSPGHVLTDTCIGIRIGTPLLFGDRKYSQNHNRDMSQNKRSSETLKHRSLINQFWVVYLRGCRLICSSRAAVYRTCSCRFKSLFWFKLAAVICLINAHPSCSQACVDSSVREDFARDEVSIFLTVTSVHACVTNGSSTTPSYCDVTQL